MIDNTEIIENINALLPFLPAFSQTGNDFMTWRSAVPRSDGIGTLPYPDYAPIVDEFRQLVSQDFWCDDHYQRAEVDAMLGDKTSIAIAAGAISKASVV
jgi:Family of unknown function (DUF6508)